METTLTNDFTDSQIEGQNMLTMSKAKKQAKEAGATKWAINYMNKENKKLEYSFIHFFNDDNFEIGYFTVSLRQFNNSIHIFERPRKWAKEYLRELEGFEAL